MAAPFAALQARSSEAVMRHLANATAVVNAGEADEVSFPVIYDRASIESLGQGQGIGATTPIALALSSDVIGSDLLTGATFSLSYGDASFGSQEWFGGGGFTIRDLQPDGTGFTLLILEAA